MRLFNPRVNLKRAAALKRETSEEPNSASTGRTTSGDSSTTVDRDSSTTSTIVDQQDSCQQDSSCRTSGTKRARTNGGSAEANGESPPTSSSPSPSHQQVSREDIKSSSAGAHDASTTSSAGASSTSSAATSTTSPKVTVASTSSSSSSATKSPDVAPVRPILTSDLSRATTTSSSDQAPLPPTITQSQKSSPTARPMRTNSARAATMRLQAAGGLGLGGLYDFLPPPDPERDRQAGEWMKEKNSYSTGEIKRTDQPSKVIFLDVDGVLRPVSRTYAVNCVSVDVGGGQNVQLPLSGDYDFKSGALSALRHIREQTGAVLVMSSEWRRHSTLKDTIEKVLRLQKISPNGLAGATTTDIERALGTGNPVGSFADRRAQEIGMYLKEHPHVTHWVALDDIDLTVADDMPRVPHRARIRGNFIRTDDQRCLTLNDAQKAIAILERLGVDDDFEAS